MTLTADPSSDAPSGAPGTQAANNAAVWRRGNFLTDDDNGVLSDAERRAVLLDLAQLPAPGGLLIFSAHNLDCLDRDGELVDSLECRVLKYVRGIVHARRGEAVHMALGLRRARNRRRGGFEVLDVLELDGRSVTGGGPGESLWLHFIARLDGVVPEVPEA